MEQYKSSKFFFVKFININRIITDELIYLFQINVKSLYKNRKSSDKLVLYLHS